MRLLGRLLWLLVGLIYRLIVLALFERWIPFPERSQAEQPAPRTDRRQRSAAGEAAPAPGAPHWRPGTQSGRSGTRPQPPRAPIFEARSAEPSPEPAPAPESERLALRARQWDERRLATSATQPGRPLRALLRDKRALAGAITLGEAFARRRFRPR